MNGFRRTGRRHARPPDAVSLELAQVHGVRATVIVAQVHGVLETVLCHKRKEVLAAYCLERSKSIALGNEPNLLRSALKGRDQHLRRHGVTPFQG